MSKDDLRPFVDIVTYFSRKRAVMSKDDLRLAPLIRDITAIKGAVTGKDDLRRRLLTHSLLRDTRLKHNVRYLQIAFNDTFQSASKIIPNVPRSDRILLEAGTPFIKREGYIGIHKIARMWGGKVVADLKTMDGALDEVELAYSAGASAATVLGDAPIETIDLFVSKCDELGLDSMVDMIGVDDPLKVLLDLKKPPSVVILHRGRDEETTRGKVIKYKHITRIRSKYDTLISAAGGVDLREARSAIFNGANIVVVNIVTSDDVWVGIRQNENVTAIANEFLKTIE